MKKGILFFSLILIAQFAIGQKMFTKSGNIKFESDTPMERVEAVNNRVVCVIDTEAGTMQWQVLVKSFQFEKALMQEHFNENYMDSNDFPKATFSGKITEGVVDWSTDGKYAITVSGTLDMHGVEREVSALASVMIVDGVTAVESSLIVKPEDYKIEIPKVVRDNIAKEVTIFVQAQLESM